MQVVSANSPLFERASYKRRKFLYFNEIFQQATPVFPFMGNLPDTTKTVFDPKQQLPPFVADKWVCYKDGFLQDKNAIYCGQVFGGVSAGNSLVATDSYAVPANPVRLNTAIDYTIQASFQVSQVLASIGTACKVFLEQLGSMFYTCQVELHADGFYVVVYNPALGVISSTFVGNGTTVGPVLYDRVFTMKIVCHNRRLRITVNESFVASGVFIGGSVPNQNTMGYGFHDNFSQPSNSSPLAAFATRFLYYGFSL